MTQKQINEHRSVKKKLSYACFECGLRLVSACHVHGREWLGTDDYSRVQYNHLLNAVLSIREVQILGDGAYFRCKCGKIIGYFEFINRIYPQHSLVMFETKELVCLRCK